MCEREFVCVTVCVVTVCVCVEITRRDDDTKT